MDMPFAALGSYRMDGAMGCRPLAHMVTHTGREALMTICEYVKEHYPSHEIVGGDSVTGDTPVILKLPSGLIEVRTINDLVGEGDWVAFPNFKVGEPGRTEKQQAPPPNGTLVWSHDKWSPIRRVIRHAVAKPIYRVLTHTGLVDVTSDHSLLTPEGEPIKPTDCAVGTPLMHGLPPASEFVAKTELHPEHAFLMGVFLGDGSSSISSVESGSKHSWYIGKNNMKLLKKCEQHLADHEGVKGRIIDTVRSSQTPRLVPSGNDYGQVRTLVRKYKNLFYDHTGRKRLPSLVLNASQAAREAFLEGFYAADGDKTQPRRCEQRGQICCQGLSMLIHSLGYVITISDRSDKRDCFRLSWSHTTDYKWETFMSELLKYKDTHGDCSVPSKYVATGGYKLYRNLNHVRSRAQYLKGKPDESARRAELIRLGVKGIKPSRPADDAPAFGTTIKKVFKLRDPAGGEFVYDLETEDGRFNSGVGAMTVKNTDSVFIHMPKLEVRENVLPLAMGGADEPAIEEVAAGGLPPSAGASARARLIAAAEDGHAIAEAVTALLRSRGAWKLRLEFEKCMFPLVILKKKHYLCAATLTLTLTLQP